MDAATRLEPRLAAADLGPRPGAPLPPAVQLWRIGRALTRYGDPDLDIATIDRGHREAMRRLKALVDELSQTYAGPEHQVLFFALRTVAIEAERARQARAQLDRFPEWVWRPVLRNRVTRIAGCLSEATRVVEGRPPDRPTTSR